ncbi:MAG: DNA cytosine methyltransferase [archaeon]
MSDLKVLDLFCGAGGLSKGFELIEEYNVIAGVDNNENHLKTFKENHNDVKSIQADLMEKLPSELLKENNIDKNNIDIVIGGPPCQGFSIVGDRNPDDERNNLVYKFINYINYIQPECIMMENVPGILSMEDGKVIEKIIKEYEKINYNIKYKKLNSVNYGVPQKRERVIFLGGKNEEIKYPKKHIQKMNIYQ